MESVQWDDANREHIARHGITPQEVEEVLNLSPKDLNHRFEQGESRFSYIGSTAKGRVLNRCCRARPAAEAGHGV